MDFHTYAGRDDYTYAYGDAHTSSQQFHLHTLLGPLVWQGLSGGSAKQIGAMRLKHIAPSHSKRATPLNKIPL